mmetsp:Transcript_122663/g.381237  ORF Transcript_122663/g.381237 Transcript_122663/m.381237 type:complete len:87 (-) Transcript_122663:493-753(-)
MPAREGLPERSQPVQATWMLAREGLPDRSQLGRAMWMLAKEGLQPQPLRLGLLAWVEHLPVLQALPASKVCSQASGRGRLYLQKTA